MKAKDFREFVLLVLSEQKGKLNAISPKKIVGLLYIRTKQYIEESHARDLMRHMALEKLVKRHQPGHSKSTFYYWID